jgi:hypothetical protein
MMPEEVPIVFSLGQPRRIIEAIEITVTLWDKNPQVYGDTATSLDHRTLNYLPCCSQSEGVRKAMAEARVLWPDYILKKQYVEWFISDVHHAV